MIATEGVGIEGMRKFVKSGAGQGEAKTSGQGQRSMFDAQRNLEWCVSALSWGSALPVPEKAETTYLAEYQPSFYGFNGFRKGIHSADHTSGKALSGSPLLKSETKAISV